MTKPEKPTVVSFKYIYDKAHPITCENCDKITSIFYIFKFSDKTEDKVCPKCFLLSDKYPKEEKYLKITDFIGYSSLIKSY
jgi:hypothetical protein